MTVEFSRAVAIRLELTEGPASAETISGSRVRAGAGLSLEFDQARVILGRGAGADVRLPHRTVSDHHCTLRLDEAGYVLVDEYSTNGTSVNGQRLVPGRGKLLRGGEQIALGGFSLTCHAGIVARNPASADHTAAVALRIVREVLGVERVPKLTVVEGPDAGKQIELTAVPSRVLIGRADTADLMLVDADASREHAEVLRDLDGILIRDLGSKNGIRIHGRAVRERRLRNGDEFILGATRIAVEDPADAHIRAIEKEPDEPEPIAQPLSEPSPDVPLQPSSPSIAEPSEPSIAPTEEPHVPLEASPARAITPRKRIGPDAIIFLLAGLILFASLAVLFVLLRS